MLDNRGPFCLLHSVQRSFYCSTIHAVLSIKNGLIVLGTGCDEGLSFAVIKTHLHRQQPQLGAHTGLHPRPSFCIFAPCSPAARPAAKELSTLCPFMGGEVSLLSLLWLQLRSIFKPCMSCTATLQARGRSSVDCLASWVGSWHWGKGKGEGRGPWGRERHGLLKQGCVFAPNAPESHIGCAAQQFW